MVHPNTEVLLVLDEVSSEHTYDWGLLEIPERLTLVLVLKPIVECAKDSKILLPLRSKMNLVKLGRQYRSATNINQLIEMMNLLFSDPRIDGMFSSLMPSVTFSKTGHEIPGDMNYWYPLKGDARGL